MSDFLAPEDDLLLFEVAAVVLIDEDQVEGVAATEAIIHIVVRRCQIRRGQVKPDGDKFSFDRRTIHNLKLAQCLVLCHSVLVCANGLFPDNAQLHHFYLDSDEVEADLA